MEKDNSSPRLLQDFSTLAAALLPLAQLFFSKLPEAVTQIFQAKQYFTGISLVTLIVSYVLIIAYQSKPWFVLTLPFQSDRVSKYNDYIRKINEAAAANKFVAGEQASQVKIKEFLKRLTAKPVKPPIQITQSNIVTLCVGVILLNAVFFVVVGQMYKPPHYLVTLQSLSYIFLIAFTALALTVYYRNTQNNRRNDEDQKLRTSRAISLATNSNCFGLIPQVKYISSFEDQNVPSNYHVLVQYQTQKYEIIADYRAQKLIAVYPY